MHRDAPFSHGEIREELERVLASPAFEASRRNRRFLGYVVDETLSGRGDRIKAYSIAISVFGRGDDFDPLQDSIVRIEAARLRRALEHYYLTAGAGAVLRIVMPKGTYVPEFLSGEARPPPPVRLHDLGPRLMVRSFEQEGEPGALPGIARTLTRQVISALTRFTELFVYGFDTTEGMDSAVRADDLAIDYELLGAVTVSQTGFHAEFLLRRAAGGRFVWAHEVERSFEVEPDPARLLALCAEIAGHVARTIGQRNGIMDSQARDSAGEAPRHFAGYQKLVDFQDYWRSLEPALFAPLLDDLERTIVADPRFAGAFACLSMLYSNAARYGYDLGPGCPRPLERALDLARRAIQLAPNSSRAYHARAIAEWFSGWPDEGLATLQIARALNPNDPELLAEFGFRSAMRMDWDVAVPLIEEAYARNPLQSGQYRMGLFFYHFSEGHYLRALYEARAIDAPGIVYVHIAAAAALSALDRMDEARACLREAEARAPGLAPRLAEDLAFRQIHPDLIERIMIAIGRVDSGWRPPVRTRQARTS